MPKSSMIHVLTWNTIDIVCASGGEAILSKTGHAFIKERMRKEDAVYGGEMSAHHYFKDFFYCDSGMIPWLLVAELLCLKKKKLSALLRERIALYPSSGEINNRIDDAQSAIKKRYNFTMVIACYLKTKQTVYPWSLNSGVLT